MTAMQIGQLLSQNSPGQIDDMNPRPSTELPRELLDSVEAIFERFALHYGAARMASHWSGLDAAKAKGYWSRKLALMPRRNIGYALQYLPERPPTVDEFVAVCRRCPPKPVSGLLTHTMTPEEHSRAREKGRAVLAEWRNRFVKAE